MLRAELERLKLYAHLLAFLQAPQGEGSKLRGRNKVLELETLLFV